MKQSANGVAHDFSNFDIEFLDELIATRSGDLPEVLSSNEVRDHYRTMFEFIDQKILADNKWKELTDVLPLWLAIAEDGYGIYRNTLPTLCCQMIGGEYEKAIPLSASWSMTCLAQRMLEDFQYQDNDDMPWSQWPEEDIVSTGLEVLLAAQSCLDYLEVEPQIASEIQDSWLVTHLQAALGQTDTKDDDSVSRFIQAMASTALMIGSTCWSGARLATSDESTLKTMWRFGVALGTTVHVSDGVTYLISELQKKYIASEPLNALSKTEFPNELRMRCMRLLQDQQAMSDFDENLEIYGDTSTLTFHQQIAKSHQAQAMMYLDEIAEAGGDTDHLRIYTQSLFSGDILGWQC